MELPADSDGSGRGSSESHQHSETLPPRGTAISAASASRLARHASAPPGQHLTLVMIQQTPGADMAFFQEAIFLFSRPHNSCALQSMQDQCALRPANHTCKQGVEDASEFVL